MSDSGYSEALSQLRHELYSPLNALRGYSELLIEEILDTPEAESTNIFLTELKKINELGAELKSLIGSIFCPEKMEFLPPRIGIKNTELKNWEKLQGILDYIRSSCQILSQNINPEFLSDLLKINRSTLKLQETIENWEQFIILYCESSAAYLTQDVLAQPQSPAFAAAQDRTSEYTLNCLKRTKDTRENNILVIDDNEENRYLLSRQLQKEGYQVRLAEDGHRGLKLIQSVKFDLILLDILMPGMDGYQVLNWLRESEWKHIPVIVISSLDDIDSISRCIEMGAEDYLHKPFNSTFLRARLGASLEKKHLRDQEALILSELAKANQEIQAFNTQLESENIRLSTELEITRKIQDMVLPKQRDLYENHALEIAGYMEPAEDVGGDYYDVIQYEKHTIIGIGDVMGHGLESGVLMLMLQSITRALVEVRSLNSQLFFEILNRVLRHNLKRMNVEKTLTLSLLDFYGDNLIITGQHEEIIIVRNQGELELIDTTSLGMLLGLEESISSYMDFYQTKIYSGDVVVLFTDGIIEAEDNNGIQYSLDRLCAIVQANHNSPPEVIKNSVTEDLKRHVSGLPLYDDATLIVVKKK